MVLSGIRPSFPGLSRSAGQITHVLLTRSPLEYPASRAFPFDLHVLSTPPAFVLSQDQTLKLLVNSRALLWLLITFLRSLFSVQFSKTIFFIALKRLHYLITSVLPCQQSFFVFLAAV